MKTTYTVEVAGTDIDCPTWEVAKAMAKSSIEAGRFPVEIRQEAWTDGRVSHIRTHVLIEDAADAAGRPLVKGSDSWRCIDSFVSHIKPAANL